MCGAAEKRVAVGGPARKTSPDVKCTPNLSEEERIATQRIAAELLKCLTTLVGLGLGYLTSKHSTPALSPGGT